MNWMPRAGSDKPDSTALDSTELDSTELDSTEPGSTEPGSTELGATSDVELARHALLEITPAESIGEPAGSIDEGDGVVSVYFTTNLPGYPGWRWTVTIAHLDGDGSVLETELTPGDDALLAPDWVPWVDRLAEYQAAQAAEAPAEDDEEDVDDDDEDDDEDDEDDETDDEDDVDEGDLLHAGDLDGVDIDDVDISVTDIAVTGASEAEQDDVAR
jgi:hypothetical protein